MKDEYIRKQDAVDYCRALMNAELVQHTDDWGYGKERYNQTEVILNFIENRQPADVVPVRHGRWKKIGEWGRVYRCNQCGNFLDFDGVNVGRGAANFCPNCGAKMDGGDEHG